MTLAAASLDGHGAGDHNVEYTFGRRPTFLAPFPFTTRQYARLLVLKGRAQQAHPLCTHRDVKLTAQGDAQCMACEAIVAKWETGLA